MVQANEGLEFMRVWLITVGEPLPIDGSHVRLYRTGLLAGMLADRGHDVVWWTSTFNHAQKVQRASTHTSVPVRDRLRLELLYAPAYQQNISLRRIRHNRITASEFLRQACLADQPDVILCSLPTLELSRAATEYGERNRVPVILDIRDLWPDMIVETVAPAWGQPFLKLLLGPMFRTVRIACASADAIVGITSECVEWGVQYAGRPRSSIDLDFPLGYKSTSPSPAAIAESESYWQQQGIFPGEMLTLCFFGNLGPLHGQGMQPVIAAARILEDRCVPVQMVICGSGDHYDKIKRSAQSLNSIKFPGWVNGAQIWTLMRMSAAGLLPYVSRKTFMRAIPNKVIEYLSAGLPVISSLKGTCEQLLSTHSCGVTYELEDSQQLAKEIIRLFQEPEVMHGMSENAKKLFRERFAAEKVYADMCDYLESRVPLKR